MTVIDLHPEDLLDKDSRGDLTADERVRLETHLGRCAACRAERVLRVDFAAELEGDDRPSALLGLVQGALKNADAEAKAEANAKADADLKLEEVAGLRRRPRRTAVVLLFAAALLGASAAGATGLTTRVWHQLRGASQDATHVEPSSALPSPTLGLPSPAVAPLPPASVATPTADLPAPDVVAVEIAAPLPAVPSPAVNLATAPSPAAHQVAAPLLAAPSPLGTAAAAAASAPAPTSALAMFDAANAARRSGDTRAALALYDSLDRQFPGSREARSARATTGRLLLDQGDAAGAAARFESYLASGAAELREEAMAGRAAALERLGRDEDESRAWAMLLATYPHTPYGPHARARVGRSLPR